MTQKEFDSLPAEQRAAIVAVWKRTQEPWEEVRERAFLSRPGAYVGIPNVFGMFFGVEPDGFTHT
jgi:hypothetical protein